MINTLRLIDHNIFYAINNLAGKNHLVDSLAVFLAGYVFVGFWVGVILAIWFKEPNFRINVYIAFGSALISRGVVELIKRIIDRLRPYEALAAVHQLIADNEHRMSFPSGHAVIYFSFAFAFYGTKYFWPFFILACIASLARVFVGVHYPIDILAGAIIGTSISLIFLRLFKSQILS